MIPERCEGCGSPAERLHHAAHEGKYLCDRCFCIYVDRRFTELFGRTEIIEQKLYLFEEGD